jgi:hypothetical protein
MFFTVLQESFRTSGLKAFLKHLLIILWQKHSLLLRRPTINHRLYKVPTLNFCNFVNISSNPAWCIFFSVVFSFVSLAEYLTRMAVFPLYIIVMSVAYTAVPLSFANIPILDSVGYQRFCDSMARFSRNPTTCLMLNPLEHVWEN